ncbi:hypothetical protein R6Q59_018562 [Mikania micrantha]
MDGCNYIAPMSRDIINFSSYMDIYEWCFQVTSSIFELVTTPVATTSIEKTFYLMKNVKTKLRKSKIYGLLNDSCIYYDEKELFKQISVENVMRHLQKMKIHREQF